MRTSILTLMRLVLVLVLGSLALSPFGNVQSAAAQTGPSVGIVCTYGPTFNLTARTGNIILSDGNVMFMWSYSETGSAFQNPGPVLCVNEGDSVTIILQNSLPEPTSIMFPGQENVQANGALAQPEFSGGNLTSLTTTASPGGSVTYSFIASSPGTYLYESGTDPKKQVEMGLFGALIVRPATVPAGGTDPNPAHYAYDRADSVFTPEEEFMILLSEIDPYLHYAVQQGRAFNMNNYHPRYWLINGRGFPDTIADNFASWLPAQPYGSLARIHPFNDSVPSTDPAFHPYPGLVRYLNAGTEDFPHHPHGHNGVVIGRDGHPLEGTSGEDLSFEKFSINIGPGQTWDVLTKWYDAEAYDEASNPVTNVIPDLANQTIGMFYSASPYLGTIGTFPPGTSTLNQCGEYYIISHNHALYQLDAWGLTMAGQITYLRIDPPLPNNCP